LVLRLASLAQDELYQPAKNPPSNLPEQIEEQLRRPVVSTGDRQAQAAVQLDVLPRAEGHLHLRDEIPVDGGPRFEIAGPENLDHGRPGPAKRALQKARAERDAPERFRFVVP
jgi:hypothetical protein